MNRNIYVYLLNKKAENPETLYEKKKSKYLNVNAALIESLDAYVSSSGKRNKDERFITAALILESVFDLIGFASFPIPGAIKKDLMGKPDFIDSNVKLSSAHNEDYAVVAYTIGREIGVDIEGEIDPKKVENLSGRFPGISSINIENKESEEETSGKIIFLEMKKNGPFEPLNLTPPDNSFTAKWTAAEAIMKCDGRGFSALGNLGDIKNSMSLSTFKTEKNDKKIYISLAIKNIL